MLTPEILDADFSLASMAVSAGVPARRVLRKMQEEWRTLVPIAKRNMGPGGPGEHGIPEIGEEERAFYDALAEPQKAAYRQLKGIIEEQGITPNLDPFSADAALDAWKQTALYGLSTQPMRAYLVGQLLASEALRNVMHGPLKPLDFRNIQFLQQHAFNEISTSFEHLKGDMRRRLIEGVQLGYNPRKVAHLIEEDLNDYRTNWELIAITETARAESQGRLQEFVDEGVELAIGSTAHDSRVCPKCKELIEGRIVNVKDTVGVSNYGKRQAEWVTCIPLHPRCRCVWLPYIPSVTHDLVARAGERIVQDAFA